MAHDRIDWHSGADNFPPDLPAEAGATHIGMYLAWAITRGLEGALHRGESQTALDAVRERRMTGREFLLLVCDGKFREAELNILGNAFTRSYYGADQPTSYFVDYDACLGANLPSLYHVADTWENFDRIAARVDQRFEEWRRGRGLE